MQKNLQERFVLIAVSLFVVLGSAFALSNLAQHGTVLGKAAVRHATVKKASKKTPPKATRATPAKPAVPGVSRAIPAEPAQPAAPAPEPAPAATGPAAVSVHDADFVLKCGQEPDVTLKPGDDPTNLRDLQRYNCIGHILDSWKDEWNNGKTYPDAEIRKRTGATPKVLEKVATKYANQVKYRYNFSGDMVLRAQGDKIEGDRYQVCRYIELWDYRKTDRAQKWDVDTGQADSSADCK